MVVVVGSHGHKYNPAVGWKIIFQQELFLFIRMRKKGITYFTYSGSEAERVKQFDSNHSEEEKKIQYI